MRTPKKIQYKLLDRKHLEIYVQHPHALRLYHKRQAAAADTTTIIIVVEVVAISIIIIIACR